MKRQGKTGVWMFVELFNNDRVMACSEWGTNYVFDVRYWNLLPEIE